MTDAAFHLTCSLTPPFWLLVTARDDGTVLEATFHDGPNPPAPSTTSRRVPLAISELAAWLNKWLADPTLSPWPRVAPTGTPFEQRLWQRLLSIPCGKTCTYGQLARELATSPRAVGQACRRNPCPIFIPCHRVIGSSKRLTGFSGSDRPHWLALKAWLLDRETLAC